MIKILSKGAWIAGALFASSAFAAPVIDQNQPSDTAYMAGFGQDDLAQSFKQSTTNISGAGIFLRAGLGSSDTITISLYDNLPNASGNLLASASAVGSAGSFFDVFWSPVAITANTTYFLVFTGSNRTLGIDGDTANPYADGQVYANAGFGSFPTYDYTFRTYHDDAQVSEPVSLALMGLGLASLGFRRRKKA